MLYMKSVTTDDYELAKKFFPVVEYNQVLFKVGTYILINNYCNVLILTNILPVISYVNNKKL